MSYMTSAGGGGAARANAFPSTEATVVTNETTTSLTYVDLTTPGPAVTITVPSSGNVRLTLATEVTFPGGGTAPQFMSYAMSGANVASATDGNALQIFCNGGGGVGTYNVQASRTVLLTGLTAGSTTWTAKYRGTDNTKTWAFDHRLIRVEPVDADQG